MKRRKLKLKLYRPFLDRIDLSPRELKHLGAATEAQKLSQNVTVHLDTFADQNIEEESEKALQSVIAILDEAAAIKSSQANHIRQWKPISTFTPISAYLNRA